MEAEGGTIVTPEPETTSSWYSDDYKDVVEAKGWKTGDDALKSYTELEKTMSQRLKMPTPESSAEEIRAFYRKTGCPENPDGYEVQVAEEMQGYRDPAAENDLKQIAYEMGVSKQAFETIVSKYYERLGQQMEQSRIDGENALREEFKDKYDENVKIAQRFAATCSEEFCTLMEQTGLGNNPVIVKEFINLGRKTMNDSLIRGEPMDADAAAYTPEFPNSPEMYRHAEGEDGAKARKWHESRGYKY